MAIETDSSGEPFGNGGDSYWVSDVSEARNIKRERGDGESGEKETLCGQFGVFMLKGMNLGMGVSLGREEGRRRKKMEKKMKKMTSSMT
ncbi:hypothetical protein PVK06_039145 [Gossypium arboreum]|uniref:Uncharacterized protein n=1 Tax=Gossypium arboreum TaxID=29729 RepID=A0ABR0N4V0_GOSAR|nr:hypothetical protein PVK06_039145 [Gossypium arboreum]